MTSDLVKAYIAYRAQRKKVQQRQRAELEKELIPWKQDVGFEIRKSRSAGETITDIAESMGTKNRNTIYEFLATLPAEREGDMEIAPEPDKTPEPDEEYQITDKENLYVQVTVNGQDYGLTRASVGDPFTAPDEWATAARDERAVYKRILAELNG